MDRSVLMPLSRLIVHKRSTRSAIAHRPLARSQIQTTTIADLCYRCDLAMRSIKPGPASLASLLLVTCGGELLPPCVRLGQLCSDGDTAIRLDLTHSKSATLDLDGDGVLDLVSAAPDVGLAIGWRQAGQRDYRLFTGGATDVKTGDIDGDGDSDVVYLTSEPAMLRTLLNNGTRQPTEGLPLTLAARPQALWLGPIDADATLDAVVASGAGTLSVITDGLTRTQTIEVDGDLAAVEVGDLDTDGHLDIVAVDRDDAGVYVVRGASSGFAAPQRFTTGVAPAYLQLLDFDGDGTLDALTHGSDPQIWFHAGDGAGGLAAAHGLGVQDEASRGFGAHRDETGRRWLFTVDANHLTASALDDLDRPARRIVSDGIQLVHGIDMDQGSVLTRGPWLGRRHSLAPAHLFTELWHGSEGSLQPLVLGDLDLDGEPELAVARRDEVQIYKKLADGQWTEHVSFAVPKYVMTMAVADVTGDGQPDLVLGDNLPSVLVAVGDGDGRFSLAPPAPLDLNPRQLHTDFAPIAGAAAVAVGSQYEVPGVHVLRFDATGNLLDQVQPISAGNMTALSSADVDHDGFDDLVALVDEAKQFSLVIVPGLDGGGWGPARVRPLSASLPDIDLENALLAVGDLDPGDTIDAVLLAQNTLVRLPDIGADVPPAPLIDPLPGIHSRDALAIADTDQDGRPDLVYCTPGALGILRLTADGELQPETPLDQFISSCGLYVDPADRSATAVTSTDRGLSVLAPDFAPGLAGTSTFNGSPAAFDHLSTGDIDGDGHTDIIVNDAASLMSPGFTVLWGNPDGQLQRATWQDGDVFRYGHIAVAPLDERPGDEIVSASSPGYFDVWTAVDGGLELLHRYRFDLSEINTVAVAKRSKDPGDIIVIGRRLADQWTVAAVRRGDSDPVIVEEAAIDLWTGMAGSTPPTLTIADLDSDGYDDIAVFPGLGQPVQLIWGDKTRTALTLPILPDLESLQNITSADMDGDGAPELVLGTDTDVLGIGFRGRTPKDPVKLTHSRAPSGLLVADMESDGLPDILRPSGTDLELTLRSPDDTDYLKLLVDPGSWSSLQAAALDDDDILDFIGLRDDAIRVRLSSPFSAPPP